MTISQVFELALQHHQAGRLAEAEALYRQILTVEPQHAEAMHLLGVIAHQVGRNDLAVDLIRQAIRLAPNIPHFHSNLGEVYRALGQLDEAMGACQQAIAFKPDLAEAHSNLGNVLLDKKRWDEAIAAYREAIALQPYLAEAHNNLGKALGEKGQLDEAMAFYRRAIALKPTYAKAHYNLGNALRDKRQLDEAMAFYRQAIALDPNLAEGYSNLGNALRDKGQWDEAIAACRAAIALKPDLAETYNNLGGVLAETGQLDSAIAAHRRALEIRPESAEYQSNIILMLHFHPQAGSRSLADEKRRWNCQFGVPVPSKITPHTNRPDPERRLRIGYVSADFRDHVAGRNLIPLFRCRDSNQFETFCYSSVRCPDELTTQFQHSVAHWRNIADLPDEAVVQLVRQDQVDILVDLNQHMTRNRLPLFTLRPAPLQVSFAGYPEGAGLEAIGYRISDRWLEGEGEGEMTNPPSPSFGGTGGECRMSKEARMTDEGSAECLVGDPGEEQVYLLDSFWCYDPCGVEFATNELPAPAAGTITFGSLNSFCKINDSVLQLWARVLNRVKNSRLILLSGFGSHRQRTVDFLARYGVESCQVEFVAFRPRAEYLKTYHRLDVALDPFPYGGHTTSLDALWMGVPVVSLAGDRPVSRAGLSVLNHLGLPELVTFSEDEYVEIAARLAADLPQLRELRRTLRSRMKNSVLMDAPRFARQIEAAYRTMWRRWCEGKEGGGG